MVLAIALTLPAMAAAAGPPPELLASADLASATPIGSPPGFFSGFGTAVAAVGDIDGNGVVDLAVGAPEDEYGVTYRGSLYLFFAGSAGTIEKSIKIDSTNLPASLALDDGDRFGSALAGIGDWNGDDVPDIAVGAVGDDDGALDAGAVWILMLDRSGSVTSARKISALTTGLEDSLSQWDSFGSSIVSLNGSLGGAAHALAVGARGDDQAGFDRGAIWLLTLGEDTSVASKRKLVGGSIDLGQDLADRAWFGESIARRGSRLAVGAPGDNTVFAPLGSLWLLDLGSDGAILATTRIDGESTTDRFGHGVDFFGDFDFDGVEDLLVGLPGRDVQIGDEWGALQVLLMNQNDTVRETRLYPPDISSAFSSSLYGRGRIGISLAVLPDLDGNLIHEVLAGAPANNGGAWLYFLNGESADGASCGDPTGDGEIQSSDALLILRAALRTAFCELLYCDVDKSGVILASDALATLRKAVSDGASLTCPTTTTTTSTTLYYVDECFEDRDCYFDPERPCCCPYECCPCVDSDRSR